MIDFLSAEKMMRLKRGIFQVNRSSRNAKEKSDPLTSDRLLKLPPQGGYVQLCILSSKIEC